MAVEAEAPTARWTVTEITLGSQRLNKARG